MHRLGFEIDSINGDKTTWSRKIGDRIYPPFFPTVRVDLFFTDKPKLRDIAEAIIRRTVKAQQERSRRAMAVIIGTAGMGDFK